jgi:tetratricopeptide (TPR) repeat protein
MAFAAGVTPSTVIDAAIGQVEAGNIDAAALALSANNASAAHSVAWYHQSALVLLGRAEQLKISGELATAQKAASAAILVLERGDALGMATATPSDRAQLYVQLAMTFDHFLGDRASARQLYQQALQLEPGLASAKAALAGYDAEAARLRKLQGGN